MTLLENNWGKVRCKECDSVMKPDQGDIFSHEDGFYVICPVCGSRIWFDAENQVISRIWNGTPFHK